MTALIAALLPETPHDLLIVQNLAELTAAIGPVAIAGLRRRAKVVVALETRHNAEITQRLPGADPISCCGRARPVPDGAALRGSGGCGCLGGGRVFRHGRSRRATPAPNRSHRAGGRGLRDQSGNHGESVTRKRRASPEASDGDAAVALAAKTGLDLILMDIQMPGKDGIAAIQEIRASPTGARLPILGFTASADKPIHQRILRAGADGVLTKPLTKPTSSGGTTGGTTESAGILDLGRIRPETRRDALGHDGFDRRRAGGGVLCLRRCATGAVGTHNTNCANTACFMGCKPWLMVWVARAGGAAGRRLAAGSGLSIAPGDRVALRAARAFWGFRCSRPLKFAFGRTWPATFIKTIRRCCTTTSTGSIPSTVASLTAPFHRPRRRGGGRRDGAVGLLPPIPGFGGGLVGGGRGRPAGRVLPFRG